jgi:hypothetical protein
MLPSESQVACTIASPRTRDIIFTPCEVLELPTETNTWAPIGACGNICTSSGPNDKPIDLSDGQPDHQGFGIFAGGLAGQDNSRPMVRQRRHRRARDDSDAS